MTGQPSKYEWNSLVIIYAISTAILYMKYSWSLVYAANIDKHLPEDAMMKFPPPASNIQRRERQFVNDHENIPFHLPIFWAAFIVQNYSNATGNGGRDGTIALSCLILIYTLARTLYTIFYNFALQPWRTVCFVISNLAVGTTTAILIYSAVLLDMTKVFPNSGIV